MSYDRSYCDKINSVKYELEAVLAKVGLTLSDINIKYGYSLEVKLNLTAKDNKQAVENDTFMLNYFCRQHGLEENPIGKIMIVRGTEYKVVSINHRMPKNSIILTRLKDNKQFHCSPDFFKRAS